MKHADVRRQLSEYLEGDLSERDEVRVRAHLEACAECSGELRALSRAVRALHELAAVEPPHDVADAVMARLRRGEGRPPRLRLGPFLDRASFAWLPLAAAVGLAALAFVEDPEGRTGWLAPAVAPAAPALRVTSQPGPAARAAAVPVAGAPRPVSLPSIATCLEGAPAGDAAADACARWYAWFVAMALEDARGFVHEVERLPAPARDPWLRRVSEFAKRSGSAPLVGQQLRTSRDPRAALIATRFDRGAPVRTVGWAGR
jgi:hypothetical protein